MAGRWIDVGFFHDLSTQVPRAFYRCVKIIHLEPQQHAVAMRRCIRLDQIRVIFNVPFVKLKDQFTVSQKPIVDMSIFVGGKIVDP